MAINWQAIASLAELGGNIALTALGTAGIVPASSAALASGIEAAVNPLVSALAGKAPVATDIQAGYGALIGSLNILKSQPGLDPVMIAKVDEYLTASQNGLTAYMTANAGFNIALFTVDGPLAPAS